MPCLHVFLYVDSTWTASCLGLDCFFSPYSCWRSGFVSVVDTRPGSDFQSTSVTMCSKPIQYRGGRRGHSSNHTALPPRAAPPKPWLSGEHPQPLIFLSSSASAAVAGWLCNAEPLCSHWPAFLGQYVDSGQTAWARISKSGGDLVNRERGLISICARIG